MSYSFTVQAATKEEALEKVSVEMAKVVLGQPVHSADEAHAKAAVKAFVGILETDATHDVSVTVNGSVTSPTVRAASVSVSASLVARKAAPKK